MWGIDCRTASAVPWYHISETEVCSAARMVTKPARKRSKTYDRAMWLFRLAELYWVSTKMRSSPELMQLETGTSIRRYFPASGTAGLARSLVSGKSRVPAPPPRITASIFSIRKREEEVGKRRRHDAKVGPRPRQAKHIPPHRGSASTHSPGEGGWHGRVSME